MADVGDRKVEVLLVHVLRLHQDVARHEPAAAQLPAAGADVAGNADQLAVGLVVANPGERLLPRREAVDRVDRMLPPAAVLAVLTDYERIPLYMPNVKTSTVHERNAGRALVEQEAHARVLMFSKRVYLLLDVREEADRLSFVDTSGRSFEVYGGSWRLAPLGTGTRVTYELTAKPAFSVPQFVLVKLMRDDAAAMIARLRAEIGGPLNIGQPAASDR